MKRGLVTAVTTGVLLASTAGASAAMLSAMDSTASGDAAYGKQTTTLMPVPKALDVRFQLPGRIVVGGDPAPVSLSAPIEQATVTALEGPFDPGAAGSGGSVDEQLSPGAALGAVPDPYQPLAGYAFTGFDAGTDLALASTPLPADNERDLAYRQNAGTVGAIPEPPFLGLVALVLLALMRALTLPAAREAPR